jgi:hypothetical protein
MGSVADQLRSETSDRVLQLPILARIELALALGRDDLALYARTNKLSDEAARRDLIKHRRQGRAYSHAAAFEP